jgi:hypothetical protein
VSSNLTRTLGIVLNWGNPNFMDVSAHIWHDVIRGTSLSHKVFSRYNIAVAAGRGFRSEANFTPM